MPWKPMGKKIVLPPATVEDAIAPTSNQRQRPIYATRKLEGLLRPRHNHRMYRAIRRKILGLVFVAIAASLTQEGRSQQPPDSDPPFVTYPEPTAAYLDRLHRKTPAPLAFREDFPGGFDAWQNAAREKLRELLGLDRIAEQCADHQPTLIFWADPIREDGYTRQLGNIETEPGISIPFWLLRPTENPPLLVRW